MSSKKTKKYRLLLDESLPPKKSYPRLNNLHNVKHIKHDLNAGGVSDPEVYKISSKERRLIVVFNKKDFKKLISPSSPSIVFLSASMPNKQIDFKLCKALRRLKNNQLKGHLIYISQRKEIVIKKI